MTKKTIEGSTLSELLAVDTTVREAHCQEQGTRIPELNSLVRAGWDQMMLNASIRAIVVADVLTISLVKGFDNVTYADRNRERAEAFRARYLEVLNLPLTSKTYIKKVLTPLKELRADITTYVTSNKSVQEKLGGNTKVSKIFQAAAMAEANAA